MSEPPEDPMMVKMNQIMATMGDLASKMKNMGEFVTITSDNVISMGLRLNENDQTINELVARSLAKSEATTEPDDDDNAENLFDTEIELSDEESIDSKVTNRKNSIDPKSKIRKKESSSKKRVTLTPNLSNSEAAELAEFRAAAQKVAVAEAAANAAAQVNVPVTTVPIVNVSSPTARLSTPAASVSMSSAVATVGPLVTVSVSEVIIDKARLVKELTLSTLQYAVNQNTHHHDTSMDSTKRIVHWISQPVLDKIYDNEKNKETDLSLRLTERSHMNTLSNNDFLLAARRFLRATSFRDYVLKFFEAMQKDLITDLVFNIEGYHLVAFNRVSNVITSMKNFHGFMRDSAKVNELAKFPALEWGTKDVQGEWQMMFQCLEPFTEHFKTKIKEAKLKKITSLDVFFAALNKVNKTLYEASLQREEEDIDFQKPPTVQMLFQSARDKKSTAVQAKSLLQRTKEAQSDSADSSVAKRWVPKDVYKAQFKSIEGENSACTSKPDDLPISAEDEDFKREFLAYSKEQHDHRCDVYQQEQHDLSYFSATNSKPTGAKYPPRGAEASKPAIVKKEHACFKQTYTQNCSESVNCLYSHEVAKMSEKLIADFWKIYENPYLSASFKQQLKNGVNSMQAVSTPASKSTSYLIADEEQDESTDFEEYSQFKRFQKLKTSFTNPSTKTPVPGSLNRVRSHGYNTPTEAEAEGD